MDTKTSLSEPSRLNELPGETFSLPNISLPWCTYFQVTKDRVHILATEIDLDDASPLIDPCKDFYLEAVTLRIKVCTTKHI